MEKASGVKLSSNITISAGDEFLESGPISDSPDTSYCRNLAIYSTGDKGQELSSDSSVVATILLLLSIKLTLVL